MKKEILLAIFKDSGALLQGHFQLTSGLHSDQYFQCAKVLQFPKYCELLCSEIAQQFVSAGIDVVVAPALGGIVVGQEVGRQLNVRTIFAERKDGVLQLRRGFTIAEGERVLVCEDVVTTGGSVDEVIAIARQQQCVVVGAGYIVDRSGGKVKFSLDAGGVQFSLLTMDVVAYRPDACPLCAAGSVAVKPGSRASA